MALDDGVGTVGSYEGRLPHFQWPENAVGDQGLVTAAHTCCECVAEPVPLIGAKAACTAVGVPRASYYCVRPVEKPDDQLDVLDLESLPDPTAGVEERVPPRSLQGTYPDSVPGEAGDP